MTFVFQNLYGGGGGHATRPSHRGFVPTVLAEWFDLTTESSSTVCLVSGQTERQAAL